MTAMLASVPTPSRKIVAMVPVGRRGAHESRRSTFLASDEAAFITGQVIFADGGASVGI
jgi:enoyl-[acyl-carrier-protein] reductase (NADH)